MKLYLLRHGQTDWNCKWKLQGRTDIPLNENGLKQAEEASRNLRKMPFEVIFSSPLRRAKKTAEIIAEPHGLQVNVDERLTEMGFGIYEGTLPELSETDQNRRLLFDEPQSYVAPADGESFEAVAERGQSFLDYLETLGYNKVLIVSHGAMIHSLLCLICGKELKDFWGTGVLKNCEALEIDYPVNHI